MSFERFEHIVNQMPERMQHAIKSCMVPSQE